MTILSCRRRAVGPAAATSLTIMHSGLLLLLWFAAVASVQFLAPAALALVLVASLLLALGLARTRVLRLLRRVRVLMLAIVVLFGWFTPGEALLVEWPELSPSREGITLALLHAGRLVAVVCAVAILLERLPVERLVGGLYSLSRPFALIGLRAGDVALRLLLVLRFVEASPRGNGPAHWKAWLRDDQDGVELPAIHLARERIGGVDVLVGVALLAALLMWGMS